MASTLRKPYHRRRKSLYDSVQELTERRHNLIHQHVVDISYSDERLIKEMNDLEEIATRVYKLITEAYGWRMEKEWSRGRPLRSSSRTDRKQQ